MSASASPRRDAPASTLASGGTAAPDWRPVLAELGPRFAAKAATHDAGDTFVSENFAELRAKHLFSLHVPTELGGGGAPFAEMCELLRTLARSCGSTALAFSMHTHLVAAMVWRWRNENAPVEPMLRRIATEQIVLVSTGGADWLSSSGRAEKVDGGYRVTARKIFASGCPSGDLLMTSAIYDDPDHGPTVLHFGVPLKADGVKVLDTWHVMGMRATGSHDVQLDGVFVPDAAIGARRVPGVYHPLVHVVAKVALPLIYSVYVGLADAARDLAVREAARRRDEPGVQLLVGEMEDELAAAHLAMADLVHAGTDAAPGVETTNRVMISRTLAARAAIRTVDKAMDVAGGSSFYRPLGLERIFRDVQAARFHPLQEKLQLRLTGRLALGLGIDG